jgi:hypothetical protein
MNTLNGSKFSMVYQWCTKGVLFFHFHCNILIIAKELSGVWVFAQALFLRPDDAFILSRILHCEEKALCLKDQLPHASIQDVQGFRYGSTYCEGLWFPVPTKDKTDYLSALQKQF